MVRSSEQLTATLCQAPTVSPFRFDFRARWALGRDFLCAPRVHTARFCAQGALWGPRLATRPMVPKVWALDCDKDQACLRRVFQE